MGRSRGSCGPAALGLLVLGACGERAVAPEPAGAGRPPAARHALLVTLDTTRWDALGVYGCPAPSSPTPTLDALARESLLFEWCRTVAPLTLPAHASMLTGLYPPRHGLRDNGAGALAEAAETLAEAARAGGLSTAAFVASAVLDARFGLAQGFDAYRGPARLERQATSHYAARPADQVVAEAVRWLEQRPRDERVLLWVHLFDPHAPYEAPAPFLDQVAGHPYLAEVARADRALAELFLALRAGGRWEETLVVVVADHGEDLLDHGEPTHASYCYDSTLRVPLLVRAPGAWRAGQRSAATASVVDVLPTVAGALELPLPGGLDGLDLLAGDPPAERGVYFETYYNFLNFGWAPTAGWADARGKYVHGPTPQLFQPRDDPLERRDLLPQDPARAEPYRAALEALARRPALASASAPLDPALLEELRALGYAAAGDAAGRLPGPLEDTGRPDPLERLDELIDFLNATALAERGRYDEAIELLERVRRRNPGHAYALDQLGFCLSQEARWGEVVEVLEARLATGSGQAATHVNLGFAHESLGHRDRALRHYRRAVELDPEHPTARENLRRLADDQDP